MIARHRAQGGGIDHRAIRLRRCTKSLSVTRLILNLWVLAICINPLVHLHAGQSDISGSGFSSNPAPHIVTKGESANFAEFISWLRSQWLENEIPGVAMAVVSAQDILDLNTWGVRNSDESTAIDKDTVFRIASISKTFAATVASQLVDQNRLNWGEPLNKVLPQLVLGTKSSSRQITLKHLMSHTTGLMPHAYSNMLDAGVMYTKIQQKFHQIPTVCEPGQCYGYQNVVFSLISDLVETSTSRSYSEFLQSEIFDPLGMKTASVGMESFIKNQNHSAPHQYYLGKWNVSSTNPAYYSVAPASGINASIEDMSRWAQANLGAYPEVMPASLLKIQHQPVVETPGRNYFNRWPGMDKSWYALGWRVFDYNGSRVVHHGGAVRGYRSEIALVPEQGIGIVVLFNAETRLANDVVPKFLSTVIIPAL